MSDSILAELKRIQKEIEKLKLFEVPKKTDLGGGGGGSGTPATTVTDETTWGIAPAVGADTKYARQDHTHGSPAQPLLTLPDHDHSGGAGDGGQFAIENLTTGDNDTTKRLAPDGAGGVEFVAGGGGGAPDDAPYVTTAADAGLSAEVVIPGLAASADIAGNGGAGTSHEYNSGDTDPTWDVAPAVHVVNTDLISHLHVQTQANTEYFGLYSWTPGAATAFDVRCKFSVGNNANAPALALMVASSDNSVRYLIQYYDKLITAYTYSGSYVAWGTNSYIYSQQGYFRIVRDASDNYAVYSSYDGITWFTNATGNAATTIAKVGFRIISTNANANDYFIDWLRTSV